MPRKTPACAPRPASGRSASMRPRPDAAENAAPAAAAERLERSFNEAAARCRGKHSQEVGVRIDLDHASMRPRPDAAENALARLGLALTGRASMRPRPDAAENERQHVLDPIRVEMLQ